MHITRRRRIELAHLLYRRCAKDPSRKLVVAAAEDDQRRNNDPRAVIVEEMAEAVVHTMSVPFGRMKCR